MPTLTRWFIKSSLVFFVLALAAGFLLAASPLWRLPSIFGALGPVYFHMFLVGWVTQLIFGVVFWMFPKYTMQKPRGSEPLGWAVFWLINIGLALRVFAEPFNAQRPGTAFGWLLALSAMLQWLAGMAFIANTWSRVKEK
jgi:cbb3-type cytochrome oxidase subunit 1